MPAVLGERLLGIAFGRDVSAVEPPNLIAHQSQQAAFVRGQQNDRAAATQAVEAGERARAHHRVLRGERLIQRDDRGRREVQRIAQRDVTALGTGANFPALRLRGAAGQLQQLGYARALFANHSDDDPGGSDHGDPIQRRQDRIPKLKRH